MVKLKAADILVLGSGPSGLAFGYTLKQRGFNGSFYILDQGKKLSERMKYDAKEAYQGIGGAGLFSDGKFSFYPSSSKLWELEKENILRKSYEEIKCLLSSETRMPVPSYPDHLSHDYLSNNNEKYALKKYPSIYLTIEERERLVNKMADFVGENILTEQKVLRIEKEETSQNYLVHVNDLSNNEQYTVKCQKLVLAGGKFFPLNRGAFGKFKKVFRRLEIGVRLVGPDECFTQLYPKVKDLNDPKWLFRGNLKDKLEVKTFCMCKDAETILCDYDGIKCYSGRADCPPTGLTNFGLNIIIKNEKLFDFKSFLAKSRDTFTYDLKTILSPGNSFVADLMGDVCGNAFQKALELLVDQFELDKNRINIIGPTIEGVGYYPDINNNLQLMEDKNVFFIGDCGGLFRGITSAMVSGAYAANQI